MCFGHKLSVHAFIYSNFALRFMLNINKNLIISCSIIFQRRQYADLCEDSHREDHHPRGILRKTQHNLKVKTSSFNLSSAFNGCLLNVVPSIT